MFSELMANFRNIPKQPHSARVTNRRPADTYKKQLTSSELMQNNPTLSPAQPNTTKNSPAQSPKDLKQINNSDLIKQLRKAIQQQIPQFLKNTLAEIPEFMLQLLQRSFSIVIDCLAQRNVEEKTIERGEAKWIRVYKDYETGTQNERDLLEKDNQALTAEVFSLRHANHKLSTDSVKAAAVFKRQKTVYLSQIKRLTNILNQSLFQVKELVLKRQQPQGQKVERQDYLVRKSRKYNDKEYQRGSRIQTWQDGVLMDDYQQEEHANSRVRLKNSENEKSRINGYFLKSSIAGVSRENGVSPARCMADLKNARPSLREPQTARLQRQTRRHLSTSAIYGQGTNNQLLSVNPSFVK